MDESIRMRGSTTVFYVGCFLFGLDRWRILCEAARKIGEFRRKRRLQAIDELLNEIHGVAVLTYANLSKEIYSPKEIDGTADIPRMSRTDNIWSQMTLFAIATGVAWLHHSGLLIGPADLYYDPKDLTIEHRTVYENMLRQNLPETAREAAAKDPARFSNDASMFEFGIIKGVEKPSSGIQPDTFQRGTNLAHHFCTQAETLVGRGSKGRILVKDRTGDVLETTAKFIE